MMLIAVIATRIPRIRSKPIILSQVVWIGFIEMRGSESFYCHTRAAAIKHFRAIRGLH